MKRKFAFLSRMRAAMTLLAALFVANVASAADGPTVTVGQFNFAKKGYEVTIDAGIGKSVWVATSKEDYEAQKYTEYDSPFKTYRAEGEHLFYSKVGKNAHVKYDTLKIEGIDSAKPFVAWLYDGSYTKGRGKNAYDFNSDPMVKALKEAYNVIPMNYDSISVEIDEGKEDKESVTRLGTDKDKAIELPYFLDLINADLVVCSDAMGQDNEKKDKVLIYKDLKDWGNGLVDTIKVTATLPEALKRLVGEVPMINLGFKNYSYTAWDWANYAVNKNESLTLKPVNQKNTYKLLKGVTFESDGSIKLATQASAVSNNVVETVQFFDVNITDYENAIMATAADDRAAMHYLKDAKYFGLGLSVDSWKYYTANVGTIVKNAADMLVKGKDLTEDRYDEATLATELVNIASSYYSVKDSAYVSTVGGDEAALNNAYAEFSFEVPEDKIIDAQLTFTIKGGDKDGLVQVMAVKAGEELDYEALKGGKAKADLEAALIETVAMTAKKETELTIDVTNEVQAADGTIIFKFANASVDGSLLNGAKLDVTTADEWAVTSYTIQYVDEKGAKIKNDTTLNDRKIGTTVKAGKYADTFQNEGGTKEYRNSKAPEVKLDEDASKNVMKLEFKTVNIYSYTVYEAFDDSVKVLTTGKNDEGTKVNVPYQKWNVVDGKLYTTGATNEQYKVELTLDKDAVKDTINYEATKIENVVFLAEGEKIEGLTSITADNSSNAAAGHAAEDTEIVTLEPGIYTIHVAMYDKKGGEVFTFKAGDEVLDSLKAGENFSEGEFEVLLSDTTTIVLAANTAEDKGLDAIYVVKTGDVVDLTADMFHEWDGFGADAKVVSETTYMEYKVGEQVDLGATVYGNGSVLGSAYADLTGAVKLVFEGTPGVTARALFNRQSMDGSSPDFVEKLTPIGENGTGEMDLTDLPYVHLNVIKLPWSGNAGTISAIKIVKLAEVSDEITEPIVTLDHTAGSGWASAAAEGYTVDSADEYFNNDRADGWSGAAFAQFSFKLPAGKTITSATLTWACNQYNGSKYTSEIYYLNPGVAIDYAAFAASEEGTTYRFTDEKTWIEQTEALQGAKNTGELHTGLTTDVTEAVKAIVAAGQTYIIFQWTGNNGSADLKGKGDAENAPQLLIEVEDEAGEKPTIAWVYTAGYGAYGYAFESDPLVQALQEDYNVVEMNLAADVNPTENEEVNSALLNADVVVVCEAMAGNNTMSNNMVKYVGQVPVIALKAYNYNSGRWSWGTPANPSPYALSFTAKATYKVLDGVTYEEDGSIKVATETPSNAIQTVTFGDGAPADMVIMGTVGDGSAMYASNAQKFFGIGLSSDCWNYYTENAGIIVKNAAAMLIAGEDLTSEAGEQPGDEDVRRWDFTNWSEETVANLIADAALGTDEGWSDDEKNDGSNMAATAGNCFWSVNTPNEAGELSANGVVIEELKGLVFGENVNNRGLAIAVNYPKALSDYHGPAYLWLGGANKQFFTIPAVAGGSYITMGIESHKTSDARGIQLLVGGEKMGDAFTPTVYAENTWQLPEGEAVDVVVDNTNGCHIYFIEVSKEAPVITGISETVKPLFEDGAIYNLQGQKVQKAQKGLYIINGKKVLVK